MGSRSLRVGLVGVGNCASSFVQGLSYYKDTPADAAVPGLMNSEIGGYGISGIVIASAFDITASKVGRDVAEAILAPPNNTVRFAAVPPTSVTVARGKTCDGLGRYLREDSGIRCAGCRCCGCLAPYRDRGFGFLSAGRFATGHRMVRGAGTSSRLCVRQLHPGFHRFEVGVAGPFQSPSSAIDRRRHQKPSRRNDCPSGTDKPVPGKGRRTLTGPINSTLAVTRIF